jgi:hypothetical protein
VNSVYRTFRTAFLWLLLPALAAAGMPAAACACSCAGGAEAKSCCSMSSHGKQRSCCQGAAHADKSCDCCDTGQGISKAPGRCGCSVQSAEPTVVNDRHANQPLEISAAWVAAPVEIVDYPRAELASARFLIPPPHDLVIELRNLRI